MRKGERTREHIIEQAAGLFNRKGFAGATLSDIMQATGLKKGGIYRHFGSKEELATEAFGLAIRRMRARFTAALEGKQSARERLRAIAEVFVGVVADPPVPGGCPLLSAAAESDHGDPLLRERVQEALGGLRGLVRQVVRVGVGRGELREDVDAEQVALVFVSLLEGAVLLSQLHGDDEPIRRAVAHLDEYVAGQSA